MSNHYNSLWVERYRPKTLEDLILDEDQKNQFRNIGDDIPNILFYGCQGTGKSTLSKIIVKDILKCQYLYINASDENGIDTIRNKVINFAQTHSIDGKKKIVILEEADGMSGESLRILRNVMEEYHETTRFILTANYINKIIDPIRSRCILFKLKFDIRECVVRCIKIILEEKIKLEDGVGKKEFTEFVKERFPDMRRIINDLQLFSSTGTLQFSKSNDVFDISKSVIDGLIREQKTSSLDIRKMIIESEKSFSNDYQQLLKGIFECVYDYEMEDSIKKSLLVDIGEHLYRDNFVLDHEINFFCCLLAMEVTCA